MGMVEKFGKVLVEIMCDEIKAKVGDMSEYTAIQVEEYKGKTYIRMSDPERNTEGVEFTIGG